MIKIISYKVAQLFPNRYPGEHEELRDEHARNKYEEEMNSHRNRYFIEITYDYDKGNVIRLEEGQFSPEDLREDFDLNDLRGTDVTSVDIVDQDGNWVENIWEIGDKDTEIGEL